MQAQVPDRYERKRAFVSKSRSGCVTCRARRIKCDETRPICRRCIISEKVCQGYLPATSRRTSKSSQSSSGSNSGPVKSPRPVPVPQVFVINVPSTSFNTEQEHRYFRLFSDTIITEIAPEFNPERWSRLILQACASVESVRYAGIAIAALGKTLEASRSSRRRGSDGLSQRFRFSQEAKTHHQYALEQYHRAITLMRIDIASGRQNIRTTLISCIVIACFESLHGNQDIASRQIHAGIDLLNDWRTRQRHTDVSRHPLGFSSPNTSEVEDFLVQAFGRMEVQLMTFRDARSAECHTSLRTEGREVAIGMPIVFENLEQARVYLDLTMRRILHFSASPPFRLGRSQAYEITGSRNVVVIPDKWNGCASITPSTNSLPVSNIEERDVVAEAAALLSELQSWEKAFDPLLQSALTTRGTDAIMALTLSINATSAQLFRCVFAKSEMDTDMFLREFSHVVWAADLQVSLREEEAQKRKLVDGNEPMLTFSFDLGILMPLYMVLMKCRHGPTRREALRILVRHKRREGLWDSDVLAGVARWVMRLEGQLDEEGATEENGNEDVLELERRTRDRRVRFDWTERKAYVRCMQIDATTGQLVERNEVLKW
ncbi:hypothetical protein BGZ60DRAFT_237056 [Tricladium varicosporioides]|nr:hypothetical protein BGZ60DRAFT_237056 [Hymenoscyphus varicosporioides]